MEDLLRKIVGSVITYPLIAGTLAGLIWTTSRQRPHRQTATEGTITPSRFVIWPILVISFGISALALYASFYKGGGGAALAVGLGFGLGGAVMSGSLTRAYDVSWTSEDITGPASYGIWPFGPRRATIRFDEIVTCGIDRMDSYYVEDAAGTRVRWNAYYGGYATLVERLVDPCTAARLKFPQE
jgi:hypothetical protein